LTLTTWAGTVAGVFLMPFMTAAQLAADVRARAADIMADEDRWV